VEHSQDRIMVQRTDRNADRRERLARALRENLKRRKAQARGRGGRQAAPAGRLERAAHEGSNAASDRENRDAHE
jgi:hypothetical protein